MKKVIINESLFDITPEIVAELFADMGSDEQARFFNHVHEVASQWHGGIGGLPMQLQYITEDDGLTIGGRSVMQYIGDYSHWGLTCRLGDIAMKRLDEQE